MAIAYKSQGAGASSETSGAAVSPASPATVDANDILIVHAYFEGTSTLPDTPAGFVILAGPYVIETTIGRHFLFGKIATGTEDGAANALGTQAVTTMRAGRCYSFSGYEAGTLAEIFGGYAHVSANSANPGMPTVTTTVRGSLAVCLVAVNDNNATAAATGESGGDWTEAVAEYTVALTPGFTLQIQTATPTANPGTMSGGTTNITNADPVGILGFEIRPYPYESFNPLDPGRKSHPRNLV